jgi:hypothetical protein
MRRGTVVVVVGVTGAACSSSHSDRRASGCVDINDGATYKFDFTFSGESFTGSTVGNFGPPMVSLSCMVSFQEKGTKL